MKHEDIASLKVYLRMMKSLQCQVAASLIEELQSRLEELNRKVDSLEKENASSKKNAPRLHGEIMNIPVKCAVLSYDEAAYKEGHRDARHAAAELVVVMQASTQ